MKGASERDLCDFVRDFWSVPRFSVTLYMTIWKDEKRYK